VWCEKLSIASLHRAGQRQQARQRRFIEISWNGDLHSVRKLEHEPRCARRHGLPDWQRHKGNLRRFILPQLIREPLTPTIKRSSRQIVPATESRHRHPAPPLLGQQLTPVTPPLPTCATSHRSPPVKDPESEKRSP